MRLQIEITELDEPRWELLQRMVLTEYDIPAKATRACVTFSYGDEERHAEMPLVVFVGLAMSLSLHQATEQISDFLQRATAALTPDALPDHLEEARNAADPQRAAERATCDHGSPVTQESPSQFEGAAPIKTFEDGCQSYGPYSGEGR